MKTFFFVATIALQIQIAVVGFIFITLISNSNELKAREQDLQERMFIMDTRSRIHYLCKDEEGSGYYDTDGFHCGKNKTANSNLL